jgi:talin
VESANALVQGNASEEKLISAAKQVASSTASLLVACKVKAGSDSTAMSRLSQAGSAVIKASESLVIAAQRAKETAEEEDEKSIYISKRKVPGIAQEIGAREEIIKKEKELEEAREKLALIHKSRYTKTQNQENGFN